MCSRVYTSVSYKYIKCHGLQHSESITTALTNISKGNSTAYGCGIMEWFR